ncbi:MAG: hypothetical protein KY444_01590, partial [Gemmatimonadetes bacterium]|nr:hypothetical protein [Gemmatimonadota bacterium]
MRRAVLAAAVLLGGCGVRTGAVLEGGPVRADAAALQARAEAAFAARPRTAEAVRSAYDGMAAAARGTIVGSPERHERLWRAARYAVWLAGRPETAAYADSALVLANTAVEEDSARVEGYYYRALAVGFVARADPLTGISAMRRIRDDASRAVELDSAFDAGGPHRVLGALYLRAPGPPTGVGSLRRAVHHLEAAHR